MKYNFSTNLLAAGKIALTLTVILTSAILISSCQHSSQSTQLTGIAFAKAPLANAAVTLVDATGKQLNTVSDATGNYTFPLQGITAPLLLSVVAEGKVENCISNSTLRPICMAAIVETLSQQQKSIGNINPLTDRIASDIAVSQGFIGPQQWVNSHKNISFNSVELQNARRELHHGFSQALRLSGIKDVAAFDPTTYSMQANDKLANLISLLNHNRNYDNNTGEAGHSILTDIGFRPIVGLSANGSYEPFDLVRAQQEFQQIKHAHQRIFIVGDSTSAVYEQLRFPRMGWGQALQAKFKSVEDIKVVVGSRAGRSSRDFYNGRWFAQMEPLIQAGDYVFINHGHNDQNCDASKPVRGAADAKNLCTYPNNAQGQPQFPEGQKELSFQHSLERYINIARERGAITILFTPTTRIKNAQGQQTTPVVHSHLTKQNSNNGYLFTGDYTQTIKNTAHTNGVPLIDLETASINFANSLSANGWKDYWLVVDPAINSFYANGVAGSTLAPDGTHFQKKGAEAMAELVVREIKANPELKDLGNLLQ